MMRFYYIHQWSFRILLPKTSKLLVLASCIIVAPASLFAQSESQAALRFSALSWTDTIRNLYYFNGGEPVSLVIPNGAPGRQREYQGATQLTFFTQGLDAEGKTNYQPVGSVRVPEGRSEQLLLFVPVGDTDRYHILPFNCEPSAFPVGAFNFCNLTSHPMALRIDDDTIEVRPRSNEVVFLPSQEQANVNVQVASSQAGQEWELIYSSRWTPPGQRRAWVFIYDGKSSRPILRKYYQSRLTQVVQVPDSQ